MRSVTNRGWTDSNRNYLVDCDLLNPAAQDRSATGGDVCAAATGNSVNFGRLGAATIANPDVLHGWGVRPRDWQFGASVQHEILPRTSIEFGYARRWFKNFFVFDNINMSPSDFQLSTITAPRHSGLPDGGGYPMSYYFLRAGANTAVQNRYTFASDYGDWTNYWHGVDFTVNARLRQGLTLQIGSSTGRSVTDNCDVVAQVPELLNAALTNPSPFTANTYQPADSCHKVESWQTQIRGFASYTIPRVDVLVSSIMRFQPNASFGFGATPEGNSTGLSAFYATPNGQVNLLQPGQVFLDRINQVDLRVGKLLRVGDKTANVAIDVLNLFNANTATAVQQNYGDGSLFLQPLTILNPRFVRFNVTFDF